MCLRCPVVCGCRVLSPHFFFRNSGGNRGQDSRSSWACSTQASLHPRRAAPLRITKEYKTPRRTPHQPRGSADRCVLTETARNRVRLLSSLPDLRILTTARYSHYQNIINEFSLPVAVLTARLMNSHYQSMFSLPGQ